MVIQRCFGDVFDRNVPRKPRLAGGVPAYRQAGRGTI
jgi:hypothetical protein